MQIIYPDAKKPPTLFMGCIFFYRHARKDCFLVEIQEIKATQENLVLEEDRVSGITYFFTVLSEKPKKLLVWGNKEEKDNILLHCQ